MSSDVVELLCIFSVTFQWVVVPGEVCENITLAWLIHGIIRSPIYYLPFGAFLMRWGLKLLQRY